MLVRIVQRIFLLIFLLILIIPHASFAQEPPTLSEHFETETSVGTFSFSFPAEWVIDPESEPGAIWLASDPAMLAEEAYIPDAVVLAIIQPDSLDILGLDLQRDIDPTVIVETFVDNLDTPDGLSDLQEGKIGEHEAVWVDLQVQNEQGMVIGLDLGGGNTSFVLVATLPGEFEAFREVAFAIVGSISLDGGSEDVAPLFDGQYTNNSISFEYPSDWVVSDDNAIGVTFLATSTEIIEAGDPSSGGLLMIVLTEQSFNEELIGSIGTTPSEIVQNTVDGFLLPVGEDGAIIKRMMVNENEAARATFLSETAEGVVIAVDLGAHYGIVIAATAPSEFADFETTILDVTSTLEITSEAVDLPEIYSSDNFAYVFNYPGGWNVDGSLEPNVVAVTNVSTTNTAVLGSGEILVFVVDGTRIGSTLGLSTDLTLPEMAEAWREIAMEDGETEAGQIENMMIGAFEAARIDVVNAEGDGIVIVIDMGDGQFAVVLATAAHDEFADAEATVLAIAESIEYIGE